MIDESGDIVAVDNPIEEVVEQEVLHTEEKQEPEIQEKQEETDGEVKKKRPSGFHRKISKLEQQLAEANARLAEISKPATLDKEPQLDEFESYDAYNRALVRYEANNIIKERDERAKQEQEQQKLIDKQHQQETSWEEKEESLGDLYDEYHELLEQNKTKNFRKELIQAARESDMGPQVIHYLLKNQNELATVNNEDVSTYAIYKKIAQIESQLSSKPAVKGSKSPAPITPVKRSSPTSVDLSNLDTDAYISQQHSHLFRKR